MTKLYPLEMRRNPPVLVNQRELAFIMGVSVRFITNLVDQELIPRIKIGRRVLFRWPQVQAALAKLEK